jgi:hypothetical protein
VRVQLHLIADGLVPVVAPCEVLKLIEFADDSFLCIFTSFKKWIIQKYFDFHKHTMLKCVNCMHL